MISTVVDFHVFLTSFPFSTASTGKSRNCGIGSTMTPASRFLTSSTLLLIATQVIAADPPTNAELQQRISELDQQVKILARNAELTKDEAESAAAKLKAAVKDSDIVIKVRGSLQGRASVAGRATDNTGADQDFYAANAANGSTSEASRFSIRRARLTVDGRSKSDWYANFTLRADNVGTSGTTSTGGSVINLYQGFIGKTFKVGDYEHDLKFGLDKIYNNDSSISTTTLLFPGDRSIATLLSAQREIGLSYQFRAPFLRAGFDIQDNPNLTRNANQPSTVGNNSVANTGNYDGRPTPATSFRIEVSPGAEYLPKKKLESYVGAYGTEILLGFDWQNSGKTYAVSNESRDLSIFGPDLLVHYDSFTFLAEYRISKFNREATNGSLAPQEIDALDGRHWDAQIGYAIPFDGGIVIEPALRFSATDWGKDFDEHSQWGANSSRDNNGITPTSLLSQGNLNSGAVNSGSTNLGSGTQFDFGLNLYWNGHANKTQIAYTRWTAETGAAETSAVTLQHQLIF